MTELAGDYRVARSAAPVREQAVIRLRSLLTERFSPGDRVTEAAVCKLLGTSRTTVREALRQMETEALIEIVPGKGPTVARVGESDVRDLYEIREVLESLAILLFVGRASVDERARLASAFGELEKAHTGGEAARVLDAKQAFYDVLFEGTHNNTISALSQRINHQVARVRLASLSAERIRAGIGELRIVHQHIMAGSGQEAQEAHAVHMRNARYAAIEAVKYLS